MKMLFLVIILAQMQKVHMIYCSHLSRSCPYHTLLKFSRSPYLDNQVPSRVSFHSMTSDPRVHAGEGGGLGEGGATAHLRKVVFLSCIKVF